MSNEHLEKVLRKARKHFKHINITGNKFSGRNSDLHQLVDQSGNKFALKVYRTKDSQEATKKLRREKTFLEHLEKKNISNTPRLKIFDYNDKWCLMTWIEGEKPTSLTKSRILEITNFAKQINHVDSVREYRHIFASEALTCIEVFSDKILQRAKLINSVQNSDKEVNREEMDRKRTIIN